MQKLQCAIVGGLDWRRCADVTREKILDRRIAIEIQNLQYAIVGGLDWRRTGVGIDIDGGDELDTNGQRNTQKELKFLNRSKHDTVDIVI